MTVPAKPGSVYCLLQPQGGLIVGRALFRPESDEPKLTTQTIQLGDLSQVWAHVGHHSQTTISGSGVGLDEEVSSLPALAEALERYCACAYTTDQFISASADELGNQALDLKTIPSCSSTELSHSRCPLVAPDKKAPMRWVRALSLLDGRITYVPVVMVYLYAGFASRKERICLPITTGCAAHTNYENAVLSGILEVLERDAISIIWLQRLPLPRLQIDELSPELAVYWERYQRSSRELQCIFFDATTDVGLPTVYGLQISRSNRRLTTLVSCSTALDPSKAVIKVMRDMAATRIAFQVPRRTPEHYTDFTGVFHGASYMARAENAGAFDFLLDGGRTRLLSEVQGPKVGEGRQALSAVVELFRRKQLAVYVIDLSADEALRCNMRVVRVIVPGLQPLSFHYRARYLGHPRIYELPKQLGYTVHAEQDLNPWPQPFC